MANITRENLKSIAEVNSMPWGPEFGNQIYNVIALIDGVETPSGWYYANCSQCSKPLSVCHGLFWCDICQGPVRYPMIRFRVNLRVIDETGHGVFTIFNQQMERLMDSTANKFVNGLGVGSFEVPAAFGSLIGKIYTFSIKMPDLLNPDLDFHNHRVVRLSEVDPFPLLVGPIETRQQGKRKKTVAAFPVAQQDPGPSSTSHSCGTAGSTCAGDD